MVLILAKLLVVVIRLIELQYLLPLKDFPGSS